MMTPTATQPVLDLTNPADVLSYLSGTPFASTKAESLSGGNANFVFRLRLAAPHEGHETLVLKHGKKIILGDFTLGVERQVWTKIIARVKPVELMRKS